MIVPSMLTPFSLLLALSIAGVESHGYLKSPRSRNFIASQEGLWSSGTSTSSYPMETCPHCLNRGGTAGQCGIVGGRSYDDNLNIEGRPMDPSPQAKYVQGQVIEVDVILTAHHRGHFEFSVCPIPIGGVASGDCFAQYPLEFVSDPLYGAPKDSEYPNRAYIAPPDHASITNIRGGTTEIHYLFRLQLPDSLVGDLVLLQWHYLTANSCTYPGYASYAFPTDWGNMQSGTEICKTISPDGNGAPEQFWNCAEISISAGDTEPTPTGPSPVAAPVVVSTTNPVGAPVAVASIAPVAAPVAVASIAPVAAPVAVASLAPVAAPVAVASIAPVAAPVAVASLAPVAAPVTVASIAPVAAPVAVASIAPVAAPIVFPTTTPSDAPVSIPVVTTAEPTQSTSSDYCGDGAVGNGLCSIPEFCCSRWGFCGEGEGYCEKGTTSTPVTPTSSPTAEALSPTTTAPQPTASNYCGDGVVGNGRCLVPKLCCSKWGFCGEGEEHCGGRIVPTPISLPPALTEPSAPAMTNISPPPTPAESSDSSLVAPIPFPDYANGDCSGVDNVMSVNFGYYQSWSVYRQPGCNPVAPSDIDVAGNKYTHLTYTFASINENFELEPWGGDADVETPQYRAFNDLKQVYPGLRTLIAVGGWTFNDPGATQTRFSDTARTAESRASFAASCVRFCREHGFDGIDLDWEYPADTSRGGQASDKVNFGLLVGAIRAAFNDAADDLTLSMAVPAAEWRLVEGYDLLALAEGLDFFNIMSYDIHGAWDRPRIIGANADMPAIFKSIGYFRDVGIPSNKMVLGLAAYGHTYNLADPSCATAGCAFSSAGSGGCAGAPGFMPYFTINENIQGGNFKSLTFNSSSGTMELVGNTNELVCFDNPATMQIKYDFAAKACFRGLMWWAVDMMKEPIELGPS